MAFLGKCQLDRRTSWKALWLLVATMVESPRWCLGLRVCLGRGASLLSLGTGGDILDQVHLGPWLTASPSPKGPEDGFLFWKRIKSFRILQGSVTWGHTGNSVLVGQTKLGCS